MQSINCAVCRKKTPFAILYKASFSKKDINPKIYSYRRIPDRKHFQFVRCLNCGLTFSNPITDPGKIIKSYKDSFFPVVEDLKTAGKVYAEFLELATANFKKKGPLLDIGCGNGFFLEEARRRGFKPLFGVEPSKDSFKSIPKTINRKNLIMDIYKKGQFEKNFFNIVCFFQVIDHIINPNEFLRNCYSVLKPGGLVIAIMHDAKSLTAKILGEKSPIFDIQHIYLFDKKTIRQIFEQNGFEVIKVTNSYSRYSIDYWLKMAPLPNFLKILSQKFTDFSFMKKKVQLNIGNMVIVARRPLEKK